METALLAVVFLAVGIGAGYAGRKYFAGKKLGSVEEQAGKRLAEAETKSKEIVLDAKERAAALLAEVKDDERNRKKELDAIEARLVSREELLEKRSGDISREEGSVRTREDALRAKEAGISQKESEAELRIEKIAGLSVKEAQERIVRRVEGRTVAGSCADDPKDRPRESRRDRKKGDRYHHGRPPALCTIACFRYHDDRLPDQR